MANRDININASLEKTTATGPGPLQVPTLNFDKYPLPQIPDPRYLAQQQYKAMQAPRPNDMAMAFQHLGRGGGTTGLRNAPQQGGYQASGGVPQGMVPTYVKPSHGFNMGGGMRPATGNEPGAVFAGYVPAAGMPQSVEVGSPGGPSPASLGPGKQQLSIQLQNQLAALSPPQRVALLAALGG